ncbi:hypothetical protein B9Z55_011415 [Caenorhabditis nigoni]|uniref:Domain of unknown function WSN domain-containing protein n=1 Tax=Caenorhabditis nigoni TaxID=1611254 RepID=A0A2G5UK17_9PELO|nr:hypothetical protein B9Z55_011415 [Caenorhabditis nigoni]
MRIQLFWIFGLLYLGYCGRPAEYLKVFSNFDLLFRELSAIARVVNAISLQASVIRKTFHPYEILGESLKANPSALNEILTTDVSGYNVSVDSLFDSLAEIQKRTEKYVLELRNASQMTEKIMEGMNIKLKKNDPVLEEYFETLTSNSTIKTLLTCDKNLVAEILKFWNTLSNQPSGLTTKTQQKDSITLMKSKIPEISKCLETLSNFPDFLDPILKKGKHLEKILEASANLKFLEGKHSTVSSYSRNLNTTVTQMLQEGLKLWNPPKIQAFKLMEDSVNLWKKLKEPEKIPELNQTVGFGRWFSRKDLKSGFFKDKISMHKSTENLEKALDGFADFGILVIRLRVEFIGFDEDFDEFLDEMRDFKNNLKVLETFENPKNGPEDLKVNRKIFDGCWTSKTSKHSKKLENFEKNIKKFASFNSTISKIRFWVNKTISTIDLEVVRNGFEEIGNLEISEKSLEEMKEAILGISNFETVEKFLERFSRLSELQKELETDFEGIKNLNLTKMTAEAVENLQTSHVSKDLNCLTSKNFKISRIHEILNFLETLFTSREHESFLSESKEIMSQFSNMRDAFIKVNDFVEKNRDKDFSGSSNNPVLKFKEPAKVATTFGSGVRALLPIWRVYQNRGQFLKIANFSKNVQDLIGSSNNDSVTRSFWKTGSASLEIQNLIGKMDALNSWSEYVQDKDILEFREVFELAKNITGFKGQDKTFSHISKQLWEYDSDDLDFDQALNSSEHLLELNLDFSNFEGELQAAKLSFVEIKDYFDEIFGLKPEEGKIIENSYLLVICISIGVFFLLVSCAFCLYGFSENGRKQYKNWYLFYFGKPQDFENRWRYSVSLPAFADARQRLPTFADACRSLLKFTDACSRLASIRRRLFNPCRRSPTLIDACRRLPTFVEGSPRSPAFADARRSMPTFTDACLRLASARRRSPTFTDACSRLASVRRRSPKFFDVCPRLLKAHQRSQTLADTRRRSPTLA